MNDGSYGTHAPVLAAALAKTTGPVMELGMGWGSTPLLHAVCAMQGKHLYSMDGDINWVREMMRAVGEPELRPGLNSLVTGYFPPEHQFRHVEPGRWCEWVTAAARWSWGVVFIDCAPGEIRKDLALALKSSAKFIILHDALQDPPHGAGNYRYESIIPQFKYHEFYTVLKPATLILSDYEPFLLGPPERVVT